MSSSFSLGSSHPTASPLNTASEEIVLVELDSPIHAAASVIREADSVHHLPPGPLLSQLPDPCKPRLCSLTTGYGQGDRLRLKLVLIEVVCSEYGNAALDHLSTLSQFPLLSPSVLRSPPAPPLDTALEEMVFVSMVSSILSLASVMWEANFWHHHLQFECQQ